jgi:hypothetical protein
MNYQNATKCGFKLDADTGEGIPNWNITLYTEYDSIESVTIQTESDGSYCFEDLTPGRVYLVCEELPEGWVQVLPDSGYACTGIGEAPFGYTFEPTSGQEELDNNFTNMKPPQNLYCGLTIGFWKENIDKYLCNWTNGRQVCSEFFTEQTANEICTAYELCGCDLESENCDKWDCIWQKLGNYNASDDCEKAEAQMIGMELTNEFFDGDFSDFNVVISTAYYPMTCKEGSVYVDCTGNCTLHEDFTCSCDSGYSCSIDECANTLWDACSPGEFGSDTCLVQTLWSFIVDEYAAGNCSVAQEIADCVNNYKEGCCDYSYGTDEYFRSQCEDSEPDCCPALGVCDGVYKPFTSSGCGICNQVKEPKAPKNNEPNGFNIRIKLLDPLFRFFD